MSIQDELSKPQYIEVISILDKSFKDITKKIDNIADRIEKNVVPRIEKIEKSFIRLQVKNGVISALSGSIASIAAIAIFYIKN
jgi:hypothetical protein